MKSYIQKIATWEMPDQDTSPTLHELVSRFQAHCCNSNCTKLYKHNGKLYKKMLIWFSATREYRTGIAWRYWVLSRQQNPNKEAAVSLASHVRMLYHQWLQPSPAVANQANVDVHYIAHLGSWLPYYITDYVTKHKRSEQDEMRRDTFTWSKSLASNTLLFMLRSVKNRQVGAVEAADRLLGHKLFSNSKLCSADPQTPDNVKWVLKPTGELVWDRKN